MTLKERIEQLADSGDKLTAAYKLRKLEWFTAKLASRLERAAQQQFNERGKA